MHINTLQTIFITSIKSWVFVIYSNIYVHTTRINVTNLVSTHVRMSYKLSKKIFIGKYNEDGFLLNTWKRPNVLEEQKM